VPPTFLIIIGMILVFSLEFLTGLGGMYGAWKLWSLRAATPADFEADKKWTKIAMGSPVVVW